jgi:hypothetical protein
LNGKKKNPELATVAFHEPLSPSLSLRLLISEHLFAFIKCIRIAALFRFELRNDQYLRQTLRPRLASHPDIMTSSVFYKFKSQKEPSRVEFDGTGISVFELKRDIIIKSGLGDGTDFDLAIFNEDGKEGKHLRM